MDNDVSIIGRILPPSGKIHQNQEIYDIDGLSCNLKATDYKNPPKVAVIGELNSGGYEKMHEQSRRVYDCDGIAPTIHTMGGGNQEIKVAEPCICAMRGRNPLNPTSRNSGEPTTQMLEIKSDGTSNALTTVQKDNLLLENNLRIRKLTPKECFRLMGFTDDDFEKARKALNDTFYGGKDRSGSQLYKQAGNSIGVSVLEHIFKQMIGVIR